MALIPSNINQLISNITSTGLAYSNRYEVTIGYPQRLYTRDDNTMRSMFVRCDSVVIPGRSLSTVPYRFYGPARNMPYEPIYSGEMNLSIILSADMRERNFFENWINSIVNPFNYKFSFYDQYVTNMTIASLDKSDNPMAVFVVEEVYPKAIGDIQMGYDRDNDFLKTEVTLCFRKYTPQYAPLPAPPPSLAREIPTLPTSNQNSPPPLLAAQGLPDPAPEFAPPPLR